MSNLKQIWKCLVCVLILCHSSFGFLSGFDVFRMGNMAEELIEKLNYINAGETVTGRVVEKSSSSCGRRYLRHSPLITDGQTSKPGDYPWHAALFRLDTEDQEKKYICGGSLLSETRVLTAGHCVYEKWIQIEPTRLTVVLGKHQLYIEEEVAQTSEVLEIKAHPRFNISTMVNDIAMLILKNKMSFNNFVRPVCLWRPNTKSEIIHQYGQVAGWGFNSDNTLSPVLTEARLFIPNDVECIRMDPLFYIRYISDMTFCAGNGNTTSVCNGDSGSGMVFYEMEGDQEVWYLRGLVSLGSFRKDSTQCDPKQYAVFTYVDQYKDFINDNL